MLLLLLLWLVNWLVGWLVNWLVGWLVNWLVGLAVYPYGILGIGIKVKVEVVLPAFAGKNHVAKSSIAMLTMLKICNYWCLTT